MTHESMNAPAATERDLKHLYRAIELAAQAQGRTSPNPLVGAVIVKGGKTIGEGYHEAAGQPHAERMALAACSEDPAGVLGANPPVEPILNKRTLLAIRGSTASLVG